MSLLNLKSLNESLEKRYSSEPESLSEAIKAVLQRMNEASMSDEDKRDSDLMRSAYRKIGGKQSNVKKLSPDELDALKRHGVDTWAWSGETKMVSPGKNDIIKGRREDNYYVMRNGHPNRNQNINNMNLADRARKMDVRNKDQDIKSTRSEYGKYQDNNRAYDANQMSSKVRKMKSNLSSRNRLQQELDNADKEYKTSVDAANAKYDKASAEAANTYGNRIAGYSKDIDNYDSQIQDILNKHKREALESFSKYLRSLNEAEMSDADKRDSELIRSAGNKLIRRKNAKLDVDELDAIKRHNLTKDYGRLRTPGGNAIQTDMYPPQANLARMADVKDKRDERNRELHRATWTGAAERNGKNYNQDGYWYDTHQAKERAYDASNMGKDYDSMSSLLNQRKNAKKGIANATARYEDTLNTAAEARDKSISWATSRSERIRKENPDQIAKHQAEIDKLLKKNESLNEAMDNRIVDSGLENTPVNNAILNSVIGQISDGIWENTPGMDKYWYPLEIEGVNIVIDSSPYVGYEHNSRNPYNEMDDSEVRKFFANKIKRIAQEYLNDNNMNPFASFNADNEEECTYLSREEIVTIGDAYKAYTQMKSN